MINRVALPERRNFSKYNLVKIGSELRDYYYKIIFYIIIKLL